MSRYYVPDALVCLGGAGIDIGQTFMRQEHILREVMADDPHPSGPSDEGPGRLDAYFVDTAMEEGVTTDFLERDDVDGFDGLVDELYDEVEGAPDRPEVHGINLTARTRDDWLDVSSLTSDELVRDEFAPATGLGAWWLTDDTSQGQEPILQPVRDKFKQGVQRRRGLTKALYRISQADTDPIADIDTAPDSVDYVAMVAGLGGGSGSGLLLDVGRRLAGDADVTLFAALPRPSGRDGTTEFRNTYAALSELEYLTLSNDSPFTNVVLLPYGAADSPDDFDRAAVNAILAYYNLHDDPSNVFNRYDVDDDNGPARYAPFTVAVPQVYRFLKEDIEDSKANFREYQQHVLDAQAAEAELYDELEAFIEEYYEEATDADYRVSDEVIADIADEYIRSLRRLVDQPVMDDLDYESAEKFRTEVDDFLGNVDEDQSETRRLVEQFPNEATRDDLEPAELVPGEVDFIDMLYDSIRLASRRLDLYEQQAYIRSESDADDFVEDLVDKALDPPIREAVALDIGKALDRTDTGSNRNLTENYRSPIHSAHDALSAEIQVLEHLKQGAENHARDLARDWGNEVEDDLEAYRSHKQLADTAEEKLDALETAVSDRLGAAAQATETTVENLEIRGTDFSDYTDLNEALAAIGIDEVDEKAVETSVEETIRARKKQLQLSKKEGSATEAIRSVFNAGEVPALEGDFDRATDRVDDDVVNGLPDTVGGRFPAAETLVADALVTDRKDDLDSRDEELRKQLTAAFTRLAERPADHTDDLGSLAGEAESFDPDMDATDRVFDPDSGILDPAFETDGDGDPVADARENLATALDEEIDWQQPTREGTERSVQAEAAVELVRERYESLLVDPFADALEERKSLRDRFERRQDAYTALSGDPGDPEKGGIVNGAGSAFANACAAIPDEDTITVFESPSRNERAFLMQSRPEDPAIVGASDHLGETTLLQNDTESQELARDLQDMIERTLDTATDYLPLREYRPTAQGHDVNPTVYNQHRGDLMVMSRLFDEHSDDDFVFEGVEQATEAIEGYFDFDQQEGFHSAQGELAGPWDVAATYFLGGVFLDNLTPAADCRSGYRDAWEEHAGADYIHPLVARHAFGIDGLSGTIESFVPGDADGAFTHRRDLLDPRRADDVAVLQQGGESEVIAELRDHHEITGFESAVAGLDDD